MLAIALLFFQSWSTPQERPIENGRWLCWSYNGDGNRAIGISEARAVSEWTKNIRAFDNEIGWKDFKADEKLVGQFAGRRMVEVLFRTSASAKPAGYMLLLGQTGQFRPIVWINSDLEVHFAPVRIVNAGGTPVLASVHRIEGTGFHHYEDYFVFDERAGIPVSLRADAVIQEALDKALPKGRSVWKGGGFDISTLRYSQSVWNEGDANCCPTGGQINLRLAMRDGRLAVTDARYSPPK